MLKISPGRLIFSARHSTFAYIHAEHLSVCPFTMSLPVEVFARVQPDVFLERHLEIGLRPKDLRKFNEFRPHSHQLGGLSSVDDASLVGSAVSKQGATVVICGITVSYTAHEKSRGAIFPNVEILRGSVNAPPSAEEMTLSERLRVLVSSLGIDKDQEAFQIHDASEPSGLNSDNYIMLNAHIQVLSRSGPCFSSCANTLLAALRDVKLPHVFVNEDSGEVEASFAKDQLKPLLLSYDHKANDWPAKSYVVWRNNAIADIQGDAEESVLGSETEISFVALQEHGEKRYKSLTIRGSSTGDGILSKEVLDDVL